MAKWKPVVITKKGLALQAKVEAGERLKFTRMVLGSGIPSNLETATKLVSEKQELEITSTKVEENTCTVYGTTTNIKVEAEYKATELGLYAQDPTVGEILYAVTVDEAPDVVPSNRSATIVTQRIGLAVAMASTANVSAVLTADGFISAQDAKNIAEEMVRDHARKATLDHPDKSVTAEKLADKSVGYRALQESGVSAGTYTSVTVDSKGRVTSGSKPTTLSGYNIGDAYTKKQAETLFVAVTQMFQGATSSRGGKSGLVPAPSSSQRDMFLSGSGAWAPLPKVLSAFQNDTKYITLEEVPDPPKKLSAFENDTKYITLNDVPKNISGLIDDKKQLGIVAGSLTENGWVKFANGLILQWGKSQQEGKAISFPITFTAPPFAIGAFFYAKSTMNGPVTAYDATKSSYRWRINGGHLGSTEYIMVLAVGV